MKNNSPENDPPFNKQQSRREFIRKSVYAAPALLTLPAVPSFAQQGSGGGAGTGDPGTGDPGTGGPGTGPTPASQINCDEPLQPINSDVATNMCELSFDADSGEVFFQDIIVDQSAVPGRLAQGNLFGTCDSFLCNAS